VAGLVLVQTEPPTGAEEGYVADFLRANAGAAVLGVLPHLPWQPASRSPAEMAEFATRHLDVEGLWERLGSLTG